MLRFNSHNRHNKLPFTHKRISYILIYYLFQCYKMTMLKYPVSIYHFQFFVKFLIFYLTSLQTFCLRVSCLQNNLFCLFRPYKQFFFPYFSSPLPPPPPPTRKIIVRPSLSLKPVFQCFVSEWKRHFKLNRHDFLVLYFCVPDLR